MKYLVTGAAGFIGSAVVEKLIAAGMQVVGIDNINDYYDTALKKSRLQRIEHSNFCFIKLDISDERSVTSLFDREKFDIVIHLAAQAGVRYSLENPMAYAQANLVGHLNVLEGCRKNNVKHLLYASSSSIYGLSKEVPFSTENNVDHPISLYAATKKSNELMAHTYSHLYKLPTTGMRFFTVYGPWGRPDMALFKFTQKIIQGEKIDIYNNGDLSRDFTYIDDVVESIFLLTDKIPSELNSSSKEHTSMIKSAPPYRVLNIGNGSPVKLMDFISSLESALGIKANANFMPMQAGDVVETWANVSDLYSLTGYRPKTTVNQGIQSFVSWYKDFYK